MKRSATALPCGCDRENGPFCEEADRLYKAAIEAYSEIKASRSFHEFDRRWVEYQKHIGIAVQEALI